MGSAVSAFLAGRWVSRFGRLLVVIGLVVITASLVALDVVTPRLQDHVGLTLAPLLLSHGDFAEPFSQALHTTIALLLVALAIAGADEVRRLRRRRATR